MNTIPRDVITINKAGVAPVAGGVNTDWDKPQLELGRYSVVENVRVHGPGFKFRPGLVRHNTTDFGTCLSLFSYKKGEKFYAQLDDGDVYEATDAPPTATTGSFGTRVLDETSLNNEGTGTVIPASWSTFRDHILFSEGKLQHVIKPAVGARPRKVVFLAAQTADMIRILEEGVDLTADVTDPGSDATTAQMTFTVADEDALYICTDFPATDFIFDLQAVVSGTGSFTFQFHDGDNWDTQTTGLTDGTSGWTTDGTFVATMAGRATDGTERPTVMFGQSGYWYRFELGSTNATEAVSYNSITYNGDFRLLENVMSPVPGYIIECQVESGTQFKTYASSTVDIGDLPIGDYLYIATHTPAWAFYLDVGSTPNTEATVAFSQVETWTGAAWEVLTNPEDGTNDLDNSGYISWDRTSKVPQMRSFQANKNYSYWYRMKWSGGIVATGVIVSVQALYHHDINDLGRSGKVSTVWKERGCYTFSEFDRDIYVSIAKRINVINGDDSAILSPGDGRYNRVTAMLPFFNEMMVFQKEEGSLGGCITLFEGYSPETFGKLVLSTRLGTFSQESVCIVDGATDTTRTTDVTQTQVAFISKYGIFITDGRAIKRISGPIDNLFDQEESNYIDINPGSGHWVKYDRAGNCLRFGIQTIESTTSSPDVYPVFHLEGNFWTFDVFPWQSITTFAEVSAVSGDVDSLQYVAGKDVTNSLDLIYRCVGGSDYDGKPDGTKVAVEVKLRPEFSFGGNYLEIKEFTLRTGANEDYTLTKKVYENGVLDTDETETFNMASDDANGIVFRERILESVQLNSQFGVELSFKNTANPADWGTGPVIYDYIHDITAVPNLD